MSKIECTSSRSVKHENSNRTNNSNGIFVARTTVLPICGKKSEKTIRHDPRVDVRARNSRRSRSQRVSRLNRLFSTLSSTPPKTNHLLSPNFMFDYRSLSLSFNLSVGCVSFVSLRSFPPFVLSRSYSSVFVGRATAVLSYRMTLQRYATNRRLGRRRRSRG